MRRMTARIASSTVAAYPFKRGKYFLRQFAARHFLIGRTDMGHWVRISGVSGFEWKIFDSRYNEPQTIAAMKRLLRPGMTVFDIGANVGYYSLLAADLVRPSGHVHSFEPTPVVAERLEENVMSNHLSPWVTVNAVAVGSGRGMAKFHLSLDDSEGNSIFASEQTSQSISVPVMSVDEYIRDHELGAIDVMKIDIEGAEMLALQGARKLLTREDAPLLIIEVNPAALKSAGTTPTQLRSVIEAFGYKCFTLELLSGRSDGAANILAAKSIHTCIIGQCDLRPFG